jgi:hypothetical protein
LIAVGLVDLVHALVATDRASGLIAVGLEINVRQLPSVVIVMMMMMMNSPMNDKNMY